MAQQASTNTPVVTGCHGTRSRSSSDVSFSRRPRKINKDEERLRVPWHPVTTGVIVLACWAISISTVAQFPRNAGIGVGILADGALIYPLWRRSPSPGE